MSDFSDVLAFAAERRAAGELVALATVIATWGSSPRPVGSLMAISDRLRVAGSVSGGCVETAVIDAAVEVMRSGSPRCLAFEVSNDSAFAVGLACGGGMRVFVEPVG